MKNPKKRILALALLSSVALSTGLTTKTGSPNNLITESLTAGAKAGALAGAVLTVGCFCYAYLSPNNKTIQLKKEAKKPEAKFFVPASWNHEKDLHITVKKGDRFRIFVEKNSEITKNQIADLHGDSPLSPVADKLHNPSYDIHRFDAKESGEGLLIFMRTKPSHRYGSVEQAVMVHVEE